jgi:hypothetical protein
VADSTVLTLPDLLAALQRLQDFDARDQRTHDPIAQQTAVLASFMEQQQAMVSAMQALTTAHAAAVSQLAEATAALAAMKLSVTMPEQARHEWTTLQVSVPQGRHQEPKVMTITRQQ